VIVTLVLGKRRGEFFLAVKMIQELFVLLVGLEPIWMRFVELLSLEMRLHKRRCRGKREEKNVFGGRKNLLLKENAMVCMN
jgi:hypothetical protein